MAISKEKEFTNSRVNKEAAGRIIKAQLSGQNSNQEKSEKMDIEKIKEEADGWVNDDGDKPQNKKKMHKGALMPDGSHLSWKQNIEKMLKK